MDLVGLWTYGIFWTGPKGLLFPGASWARGGGRPWLAERTWEVPVAFVTRVGGGVPLRISDNTKKSVRFGIALNGKTNSCDCRLQRLNRSYSTREEVHAKTHTRVTTMQHVNTARYSLICWFKLDRTSSALFIDPWIIKALELCSRVKPYSWNKMQMKLEKCHQCFKYVLLEQVTHGCVFVNCDSCGSTGYVALLTCRAICLLHTISCIICMRISSWAASAQEPSNLSTAWKAREASSYLWRKNQKKKTRWALPACSPPPTESTNLYMLTSTCSQNKWVNKMNPGCSLTRVDSTMLQWGQSDKSHSDLDSPA